jgi:CTP synthase (UTP-ammonia lyase)
MCVQKGTKTYNAYKKEFINERHRHRYEVNNKFRRKKLVDAGLITSGVSPDNHLVEMIELQIIRGLSPYNFIRNINRGHSIPTRCSENL